MSSNPVDENTIAVIWPPLQPSTAQSSAAIVAELESRGYEVRDSPPSISAARLPEGSLVLVDIAARTPEVYLALGELCGIRLQAPAALMAAAVGTVELTTAPADLGWPNIIPYRRYDAANTASIHFAVGEAVEQAVELAPPRPRAAGLNAIRAAVPETVGKLFATDLLIAMAVTLYILHIGRITEERLAASIRFPPFPTRDDADLFMRQLFGSDVPDELREELLDALEQRLELANSDPENASFETALLYRPNLDATRTERNAEQTAALLETLSPIAGAAVNEGQDLHDWGPGRTAVSLIARLVVSQALPSDLGTMRRLLDNDTELRMIATLGGALFLRNSIEILARTDMNDPYTRLGLWLAELTDAWGGRPGIERAVRESPELIQYMTGLEAFAKRDGAIFLLEHPFHFRVLLEVLSGENRRYPAEPVLNAEALKRVWRTPDLLDAFCWSREQLPVVANLLVQGGRNLAFVQHYAACGRTPLTSSFARLSYETRSAMRPPSWVEWPTAFERKRRDPVRNEPNTVAHVQVVTQREFWLGRLWRGVPDENDLRAFCGELAGWDGTPVTDTSLADRIWDAATWLGRGVVVDTLTEVRTGAWLLEALRLRLHSTPLPADWDAPDKRDSTDRTLKEIAELRCVLSTMCLFSADYLDGTGDGLTSFGSSIAMLATSPWFQQMGADLNQRRKRFAAMIEEGRRRLADELALATGELGGWDGMLGDDET